MSSAKKHVFIVGPSRSGTSAFARLLGRHSQIVMGVERYKTTPVAEVTDANFTKDVFFGEGLAMAKSDAAHYRIQKEKFDSALWVGDKVPRWLASVPLLKEKFPEAVIFCMLRDPRDVGFSFQSKGDAATGGFWEGKTFASGVRSAVESYTTAKRLIEQRVPGFHMIDYDRIFPWDVDYLSQMLALLDLTPDKAILDYYVSSKAKSEKVAEKSRVMDAEMAAHLDRAVDPQMMSFLRSQSLNAPVAATAD